MPSSVGGECRPQPAPVQNCVGTSQAGPFGWPTSGSADRSKIKDYHVHVRRTEINQDMFLFGFHACVIAWILWCPWTLAIVDYGRAPPLRDRVVC
jgi:hypothetical protein